MKRETTATIFTHSEPVHRSAVIRSGFSLIETLHLLHHHCFGPVDPSEQIEGINKSYIVQVVVPDRAINKTLVSLLTERIARRSHYRYVNGKLSPAVSGASFRKGMLAARLFCILTSKRLMDMVHIVIGFDVFLECFVWL